MEKLHKRLKSKGGFSLIELLLTIVAMLLVTELITMTIQLSTKYYTKSVRSSESQTLSGALATAIQQELQYATKIQPSGSTADGDGFYPGYTYYSRARQHGSGCTLEVKDDGRIYVRKGSGSEAKYYALVGAKTYTYGMTAQMSCKWNLDGYFQVELAIQSGEDTLTETSFRVYPLNDGN